MATTFGMDWGVPSQFQLPQIQIPGVPPYPNPGAFGGMLPNTPNTLDAMSDNFATSGIPNAGGVAAGAGGGNWWDGMVGTKDKPGWGNMAMGAAGGIFNAWNGMKMYGLAKDTLEQNKQQFAQNFGAQQKMTNARLEDRQAARVASNPGAYQSVGDYMKKNGV